MRFIVSRASDQFMDCEHPTPNWSPHHEATWNEKLEDWVVEVPSLESLLSLANGRGESLTIRQIGKGLPHVEVDDVTCNHF